MSDEKDFQNFVIHYYLQDNSHSMNAFVRNQLEREVLKTIQSLAHILELDIQIESQAYEEGGLIETLKINFKEVVGFATPILKDLIYCYITGKKDKIQLENEIKRVELADKKLDLHKKTIELDNMYESKSATKYVSNFYKKAKDYSKIEKIGYKVDNDEEEVIDRSLFGSFIIEDTKDIMTDEEAHIIIISPVLSEETYKWKGIYQGEKIDFSMADSLFKKDIISGKYEFANGSVIECCLETKITLDDAQEIKNKTYRVLEVYKIQKDKTSNPYLRKVKKQKRAKIDNNRSLFDWEDSN
ncbi:hypothetical protein [Helicobacter typhlonius]|uniref:hypothetical protein n=1 Tax=Helicobacter typhlonius TaxID=76936 RepID=UPI002FE302D3